MLRQYYKYIRPGAVRLEATTTDQWADPVAFVNSDGRYVVVILAEGPGTVSIQHLPPGMYAISYSTANTFDVTLPDVHVAEGQSLTVNIPTAGVFTLHTR